MWKKRYQDRRPTSAVVVATLLFLCPLLSSVGSAAEPMVAAGRFHTLALQGDGTVLKWDALGSLDTPVAVVGLSGAASIAAGALHSAAVRSDRTVWTWGRNDAGQLGDGTTTAREVPAPVTGIANVVAVAAGESHTLALRGDGSVESWGSNSDGQLGQGAAPAAPLIPGQVGVLTDVVAIAAGGRHSLALRGDGSVWSWGSNSHGQLGRAGPGGSEPTPIAGLGGFIAIAAGRDHSVAVRSDGTVWCWGAYAGGLDAAHEAQPTPRQAAGVEDAAEVAAGDGHTIARTRGGGLWVWGKDDYGQLGVLGSGASVAIPMSVAAPGVVTRIAAGDRHTVAVLADGSVWAWGSNDRGQIGDGSLLQSSAPQVIIPSGMSSVHAGARHSLAVMDGSVWAWGENSYGAIGQPLDVPWTSLAGQVLSGAYPLDAVAEVAASRDTVSYNGYSAALRTDGTVWSWGFGGDGRLGGGAPYLLDSYPPTQALGTTDPTGFLTGVTAISLGAAHTLALQDNGTVWAWGDCAQGQCGDGSPATPPTDRAEPAPVVGLSGIVAIAAGSNHGLAVSDAGTVWAWGDNSHGQLGDNSGMSQRAPVQVPVPTAVQSVAAGEYHSLARGDDGRVWYWGALRQEAGFVHVSALPMEVWGPWGPGGVAAIWAGQGQSFAQATGGTVWAWGNNDAGQLCDGTKWWRDAPVEVPGLAGVASISAGGSHTLALTGAGGILGCGDNLYGQLAVPRVSKYSAPTRVVNADATGSVDLGQASVVEPHFAPAGGEYEQPQDVFVSSLSAGATFRYTLDGAVPTCDTGTLLLAGNTVPIDVSATLTAIGCRDGWLDSPVASAVYTLRVAAPTFTPEGGTYAVGQDVTIATTTPGATIRYTTDGTTEPTPTVGTELSAGQTVSLSADTTLKAVAYRTGWETSPVASTTYAFKVATPTLDPPAGTYTGLHAVTIATSTPGASIRYTTNGMVPSDTVGTVIASGDSVTMSQSGTLQAVAYRTGWAISDVASAAYTLRVSPPTFDPPAGAYTGTQAVTIATSTPGASIYYTTDNTVPSAATGTLFVPGQPVTLSESATFRAIAYRTGRVESEVASASYTLQVSPPTFDPPGGTYSEAQAVTIATTTSGASIRYTTDGSEPSPAAGTELPAGQTATVAAGTTLKAVAYRSGWTASSSATATYAFQVPSPTFDPPGGTYLGAQSVVIATTVPSAMICYTTDGSDPTLATCSIQATGESAAVSQTKTLKAIAFRAGWLNSPVAAAAYTINPPAATPVFDPPGGTYSGAQEVRITTGTPGAAIRYTTDGSDPTPTNGTVLGEGQAVAVAETSTLKAVASKEGLPDSPVAVAVYTIVLPVSEPVFSPPAGSYATTQTVSISTITPEATIRYTIDGSEPTPTSGTLLTAGQTVTVSETATLKAIAYREGWADSPVATATYEIADLVEAPVFNPPAGVYSLAQTVSITTSTPGATVRYTTDGSDPTTGAGFELTSGQTVSVSGTRMLKALAYKAGLQDSPVAEAMYVLVIPQAPHAVVAGTVRDSASGEPIRNARVTFQPGGLVVATTAMGTFSLYLEPGTYALLIEEPGHAAAQRDGVVAAAGAQVDIGDVALEPLPSAGEEVSFDSGGSDSSGGCFVRACGRGFSPIAAGLLTAAAWVATRRRKTG